MTLLKNFLSCKIPMKLTADDDLNSVLCLADGNFFFGKSIGILGEAIGEICFNTSITGYQEILTDPSYKGQLINFTFPHIGNIGCNKDDAESNAPQCHGLIIREDITLSSNYRSEIDLNDWLKKHSLAGICNIDTRRLTKHIRINGAQTGIIYNAKKGQEIDTDILINKIKDLPTLKGKDLASQATTSKQYIFKESKSSANHIAVIDYGIKQNILNCLSDFDINISVVPANISFDELKSINPDGVLLSNGPGDPMATSIIALPLIQELLINKIPTFGICLGHQLLSLACNLRTIKMHQGHRGANHPVKNYGRDIVEITSQNHGFCVEDKNIPNNIEITHRSLFDNTIQGIKIKDGPAFSVQYHPESSPGPHDSRYLFAEFIQLIKESKCQK